MTTLDSTTATIPGPEAPHDTGKDDAEGEHDERRLRADREDSR